MKKGPLISMIWETRFSDKIKPLWHLSIWFPRFLSNRNCHITEIPNCKSTTGGGQPLTNKQIIKQKRFNSYFLIKYVLFFNAYTFTYSLSLSLSLSIFINQHKVFIPISVMYVCICVCIYKNCQFYTQPYGLKKKKTKKKTLLP